MVGGGHHHRSVKQTNKRHGKKKENNPGAGKANVKKLDNMNKTERVNNAKQVRQNKHGKVLEKKRMGCTGIIPPKVIVLVPFHEQSNCLLAKEKLLRACGYTGTVNPLELYTVQLPSFAQTSGQSKQRATFVEAPRDLLAMLDVCKTADLMLCVFGPEVSLERPCFDEPGYKALTALKMQGIPSVVGLMHGFPTLAPKKVVDAKKLVQRYFQSEFINEKILCGDTPEEAKSLVRVLGNVTPKPLKWRINRGYMLVDKAEYNDEKKMIAMTGYIRGSGITETHLVHLTGFGDYQVARIQTMADPCSIAHSTPDEFRDTKEQVSLDRLRPYDPMANEQTWPTEEELQLAEAMRRGQIRASLDMEGLGMDDEEDDDDDDDAMETEMDGEETMSRMNAATDADIDDASDIDCDEDDLEPFSPEEVQKERRKRQIEFETRAAEDLQFPDEVDTPLDQEAKVRFQKYRGLKSFRAATWDRYEELPIAYSRIWEFSNFKAASKQFKNKFLDDASKNGFQGRYICVYLKCNSPPHVEKGQPLVLSTLYDTERKVSVVHMQMARLPEYEETIKSKMLMGVNCGFRRFPVRPIYSLLPKKSNEKDKHLFQRFFHPSSTVCMSVYCPIIYTPCPVLMFDQKGSLAAWGSVQTADPKRLIIKRVMLTGYPFRVHKCKAVIRHMFFNPPDIRWFKPVELVTKNGIRGNIKEPLGTHGYMKCQFGDRIKQDDTVCLNLYKRAYPKWYPPSWGGDENDAVDA